MLLRSARTVPLSWLLLLCLCSIAGCGQSDEIRTYTVPKPPKQAVDPSEAEPEIPPAPAGAEKKRFLAYLIPTTDSNFFYTVRFFNDTNVVNHLEPEFEAFVQSLRMPANPEQDPTYTIPPGWRVGPAPSREKAAFRIVTLHKGPKSSPIEMYLSKPSGGGNLLNVNRWLKEFVGLPEVTAEELPKVLIEKTINDKKVFRVDLRGPGVIGGGKPPFAGK